MLMQTQSGLLNLQAQFLWEQGMYVVGGAGAGGAGFLKAGGVAEGHRRVAVAHTQVPGARTQIRQSSFFLAT